MSFYGTWLQQYTTIAFIACIAGTSTTDVRAAAVADITCTASNTTVNFGAYDVLSGSPLDGVGSITVTCVSNGANNATVTYTATLPSTATARQLAPPSGSDRLSYTVYVDSARTQVWGDGTGGTFTISGSMFVKKNTTATSPTHTYYARISPGGQDVSAASPGPSPTTYTQTLTVTVTCTGSTAC